MRKQRERERTMHRVGWYGEALDAIEKICRRQRFMTSDDLSEDLGKEPPHFNGMGAVMRQAQKDGTIVTTGRIAHSTRATRRGSMIQVWESRLFKGIERNDELESFIAEREHRAADPNQGALAI